MADFHFVHFAHGHCPARALEPPELMMVFEAGLFDRGQVSKRSPRESLSAAVHGGTVTHEQAKRARHANAVHNFISFSRHHRCVRQGGRFNAAGSLVAVGGTPEVLGSDSGPVTRAGSAA
jgi:hypothetical protein